MSKQTRASKPRPYLLIVEHRDGTTKRTRFVSRASAMDKVRDERQYMGGAVTRIILKDTDTNEQIVHMGTL